MIKVGITGQSGFIGYHLYQALGLQPKKFERIEFNKDFFNDSNKLRNFVNSCDIVVHLAAIIRHNNPNKIKKNNTDLVDKLINACNKADSKPIVFFASSTQEKSKTSYGLSKKMTSNLFQDWSMKNEIQSRAMIIPNVFGPFCKPFYNSVIATFCHQLVNNENPVIEIDKSLKLIFINDLVNEIIHHIDKAINNKKKSLFLRITIKHSDAVKVSDILDKLNKYKNLYFNNGILPNLNNPFDRNLFNTFLCYINFKKFYPFRLENNVDERGSFVETVKFNSEGQVSFSTTAPGITRGNHFHTRKAERFTVIRGKARIDIRRIGSDKTISFYLDGSNPSFVDMPIFHTHNITNIGKGDLYTIFWTNEYYDVNDPDTYFQKV